MKLEYSTQGDIQYAQKEWQEKNRSLNQRLVWIVYFFFLVLLGTVETRRTRRKKIGMSLYWMRETQWLTRYPERLTTT